MKNFKIKTKLILLFIIIKVVPLLLLSYIAIEGAKNLNTYFQETTKDTFAKSKNIIETTATTTISDSVKALDKKSQFTLERLSYETAHNVASFLYERDKDLLFLSSLEINDKILHNFRKIKTANIAIHKKYIYNNITKKWEPILKNNNQKEQSNSSLKDNAKEYNVNYLPNINYQKTPLYKEIQFIDLEGQEIYKSSSINKQKNNITKKTNTYCNAEEYFQKISKLNNGEIYVSNVIGEYVSSGLIGTFTKEKAKKMNIDFKPQNHAYAGKENPVGKRFEGIIRFATPIFKNNKKIGYISFALDHRHIMEFTDSLDPLVQNTKQDIADASSGNYAFMWDNKGRNISHARDYFIVGYDKKTGKQVPGWVSSDIADKFKNSNSNNLINFLDKYPEFENQSLKKKPNIAQLKNKGEIGLDCRYLNFAPQCKGWMDLTEEGGYGSFVIFWSGVWKLTTAAAIPYYTGQYGDNKRGFGFVTIGANVDEFHLAANETKKNIDTILNTQIKTMKEELDENKFSIINYISNLTNELIIVTLIMLVIVIAIAIWMSNLVTSKIANLLKGTKEYSKENFDYKIAVTSKDEIGELENSFNEMANEIKGLIQTQTNTNTLLDIKVKEANSASKAKSDFLASMSHEIRTPLNAILGFIGILKADEKESSKLKYYNIIETSGDSLLSIINDILDFSKIESDHILIDSIKVNLYEQLLNITKQFTENKNNKNLTFNTHISKDLSQYFLIDLTRLTQVLNNLLSNAIKFSNENTIIKIDASYQKQNSTLFVSVENDGIEIAKDKQNLIFDAFTQEDNTTTRKYGGTGLGLTISKRLIELMGGELKLDNTKKDGARFYFEITVKEDVNNFDNKKDISKNIIKNIQKEKPDINILIVEDNLTNQMFMKVLMQKLSLKFQIANNGEEAVKLYKENKFNLILMDENMPIMSGSEATIKIRELESSSDSHIPIIALTANALKEDKERFLNVGMDDYLSKPLKKQDLLDMIERYT